MSLDDAASAPPNLPAFHRKATGLVRELSIFDQATYNLAASNPAALIVFGIGALTIFPRSNIFVATIAATLLSICVWVVFALLSAAIPRLGGDYTFNSRILHPVVGLAGNVAQFISALIAMALTAYLFTVTGIFSALSIYGSVTDSSRVTRYSANFSSTHQWVTFLIAVAVLILLTVLSIRGTRIAARTMAVMESIGIVGFIVAILIMLFTSQASFKSSLDGALGSGAYSHAVHAIHGQGVTPSEGGYSAKATIGAFYFILTFIVWLFWSTYLVAEFKGANQRRRQLTTMIAPGIVYALVVMAYYKIALSTTGYSFLVSALSGNLPAGGGAVGTNGYAYFAAVIASQPVVVALLALASITWWFPACFANASMCQRAILTWSLDGLLPKRAGDVSERTHTPVVAIVTVAVAGAGLAAWEAFSSNFFQFIVYINLFGFVSIGLVGLAAATMRWRRPDLYFGSPAEWRVAGIEILPVVGVLTFIGSCVIYGLALYFHTPLGLAHPVRVGLAPVVVVAAAVAWWLGARALQKSRGIDLDLAFRELPPE